MLTGSLSQSSLLSLPLSLPLSLLLSLSPLSLPLLPLLPLLLAPPLPSSSRSLPNRSVRLGLLTLQPYPYSFVLLLPLLRLLRLLRLLPPLDVDGGSGAEEVALLPLLLLLLVLLLALLLLPPVMSRAFDASASTWLEKAFAFASRCIGFNV